MNDSNETNSQGSPQPAAPQELGFSPWQRLKTKRISYLTIPLLVMATITEFVILATGWKYQQTVCLPQGMGVTFFGIGPIGATILAVELLKLPLAIWTASRVGWQKGFMLVIGLPLICVLTFQLVKDMAVYEMGTAMTPASQMLEKAATEEIKIAQLNGELTAIEQKKSDREHKLADLSAKQAKAKADLEESLKRNDATRQDAITLTEYQKKELSEVEARQATIIKQFDADTAQLTKAIADLRARREIELGRATKWNAEEARIENAYKAKLAEYTNKKTAYEKDKAEYDKANFIRRKLMREPVDPGVPPDREVNTIVKPTLVAEIDAQIKARETELSAVNTKRRDRVAQVDADARRLREEFDRRSGTKREESDRKREELLAALAASDKEWKAEREQIDLELAAAVKNVDGLRAQVDAARKKAETFYEAREASIRNTQVHRIATTVEIVRGLVMGERPMSIKATSKERGDILTDQISMVRIWVYPVLAFIVAFLPTLMVEIGFSTLFKPEQQQPAHRLGFFGRRLHWLYTRAGRQKILRAERTAREASAEIAASSKALLDKEAELLAANEKLAVAAAVNEDQLKKKEGEWETKFAALTDSLNQALVEKDSMRDFQQLEIERQVQMRQNAWSDRLTQMRQELDAQHAANEAERTAMAQEHHKKLLEISEDCRAQVAQARRQMADAELAAEENLARLGHELKEALNSRDAACSQLELQKESLSLQLTQVQKDAARDLEKAARQEMHRLERQQLEFAKTLRQRNEEFEHRLKRREQELSLAFETRVAEEQAKVEQDIRHREEEFERQSEARVRDVSARWNQELQQREEAAQIRLKQREQQLQTQAEVRYNDAQAQAAQELRRRELETERQLEALSREADTRLKKELQQRDLEFHAKLKQREQESTARAGARETELQNQWAADLRVREEEWERQAESRVRAVEARVTHDAQEKEEQFQSNLRQRDQQWQVKLDAARAELEAQNEQALRRREVDAAASQRALRELEVQIRKEMQQKEDAAQTEARQREQTLVAQLTAQAKANELAAQTQWELEAEKKASAAVAAAISPFKALLARAEQERDKASESASIAVSQAQELEKKLTEASSFLSTWRNGKPLVGGRG